MKPNKKIYRAKLIKLLGDLPSLKRKISSETIYVKEYDYYFCEKIILNLNGFELVPAYFIYPKERNKKYPVILYNHAHGGNYKLGKDELLLGREILQKPPYAEVLARNGYAALCIDTWCFGERSVKSESSTFKEMLWHGRVLWGMMVYDSLRAIDYICSRNEIDINRIGTLGMSMGSTMAWWIAALDDRIKICIDICCLTDFDELIKTNSLDRHGLYYYVPSLLKYFSAAEINSLITPRPHLSLAGIHDPLTPQKGLDKIDNYLKTVYKENNSSDAWKLLRFKSKHKETKEMRKQIIKFLKKWL